MVFLMLALLSAPAAFAAKDTDKDGLPDTWERTKTPTGVDLKKLGASWRHKDVFVEIDFQKGISRSVVSCAELDRLYNAFKNAPLTNPDKKKGVRLHLDAGKTCGSRKYNLGGSSGFSVSGCANPSNNSSGLKAKRLRVFHIASVVNGICGGPAGQAGTTDFLVAVHGGGGFAHIFMHELGHVFGLDHGSPVNSFSVMSKVLSRYPSRAQAIDYNRFRIEALDESALSEVNGLQSSAAGEAYLSGFYPQFFCLGRRHAGVLGAGERRERERRFRLRRLPVLDAACEPVDRSEPGVGRHQRGRRDRRHPRCARRMADVEIR